VGWSDTARLIDRVTLIRSYHDFWASRADRDLRYRDVMENPARVLTELASRCDCNLAPDTILEIAQTLADLKATPSPGAAHDMTTLMHAGHRTDGRPDRFRQSLDPAVAAEIVRLHGHWLERLEYE
jgi:hypothetical protein